jgi:hypothetical protein
MGKGEWHMRVDKISGAESKMWAEVFALRDLTGIVEEGE